MSLNYSLVVPPTIEPISLSLAKKQVRIDIPDDNELLTTYIEVARDYCESYCNRAFYPQTWQLFLDTFPFGDWRSTTPPDQRDPSNFSKYWSDLAIRLPKPMCTAVLSINYKDQTGTPQVLDPTLYAVDANSRPARIVPGPGRIWPLTQYYLPGSVNVIYTAASYVATITENVTLTGAGPFLGTLAKQVISITSVKDTGGADLTYTSSIVNDDNGDPTSTTQLSFAANPTGGVAVVTYQAGVMPASIKMAMLLIISHLYEHREENTELNLKTLPLGVEAFLARHRFENFGVYQDGY
jgi:hypothetical protein